MKKLLLIWALVWGFSNFATAQRTITGSITDDKNEPLIGASIVIKGTIKGTVSDLDGKFELSVPNDAKMLVFSFTGFTTQEIALGATNVVNVQMSEGLILNETVVTALGISKSDKSIGYAVTNVSGMSITSSGEPNVVQSLASKAAGVNIVSSAGVPGASSKILIRGNSTFTGNNQPLFVVDGVPYDNSTNTTSPQDYPFNANLQGVNESNRGLDLNPGDIENISVLKGPSAAALYGTRGANGVILITTKKGSKGLHVNYGVSYDISEVNKLPNFQKIYGQGNGGGSLTSDVGTAAAGTPNSWGPKATQTFDNDGAYFRKGELLNNQLSISGGTDKSTFFLAFNNTNQTGIIPNTDFKRNTVRLNASTGTENFRINAGVSYANTRDTKAQNGSNLSGIMLPLMRAPIDFNLLGGDAPNGYENLDGTQQTFVPIYDNPFWTAYKSPRTGNVNRITGNVAFEYSPLPWLSFTYRIGTDFYNDQVKQIFAQGANNINGNGEIWEASNNHYEVLSNFFGRVDKRFGDVSFSALLGTDLNHRFDKINFARGLDLTIPDFYNLSNATNLYTDETSTTKRLAGVYGSVDLGYKDFVYLTVTGRNDWASSFGPLAKSSFFYPSVSLSFVPTELIAKNDILDYAKFRISYAVAGREPLAYTSKTYYLQPTVTDGFTNGLGFPYLGFNGFGISKTLGNELLRPELNTSYETGLDVRLLKNRISLGFTYYHAFANDLLVNQPIARATGFRTYRTNIGEMINKGIEIEADAWIVKTKGFNWKLGGNFTMNKSEVTKLAPGVDQISLESAFTGIGSYAIVGQPYGAFFGEKWLRDAQGRIIVNAAGIPQKDPEEGYIGNPYPKWTAAIRNTFSYKGLSLFGLLDIREGSSVWGGTIGRLNRIGRTAITADRGRTYIVEGVQADGTPNTTPISALTYFSQVVGDGGAAQEALVYDGSWLRLREVTLSYDLPKIAKGKIVKNITVYATGRNLWLKTDYPGVDPETSLTGAGSNIGGFDYFNMPGSKSYIVGLRASF